MYFRDILNLIQPLLLAHASFLERRFCILQETKNQRKSYKPTKLGIVQALLEILLLFRFTFHCL